MKPTEPLPLNHSWPLSEQPRQFELGLVLNSAVIDMVGPTEVGGLDVHHAGVWECDLTDDSLTWSGGVYDIFGLPRGTKVSRDEATSFYCEESARRDGTAPQLCDRAPGAASRWTPRFVRLSAAAAGCA